MNKNEYYKEEIKYPGELKIGSPEGVGVRRLQQFLNLAIYYETGKRNRINDDDDFGGITEKTLKHFQEVYGLKVTGILNEETWGILVNPLLLGFESPIHYTRSLKANAIERARVMLNYSPIEIGSNCGPWVRSLMHGHDGSWAAWCAGLVSTCYHLEAKRMFENGLGNQILFQWSWSVPEMVAQAKAEGRWIEPSEVGQRLIEPGDIFVCVDNSPNTKCKYFHTGFVDEFYSSPLYIETIEGNTNDEGVAEGFEMCKRTRSLTKGNVGIIKAYK